MRSAFSSLLVVSLTSILVPNAEAWEVLEGPIFNPATQHAYYLLTSDTWAAYQEAAQILGGNLATINDEAEDQWVFSTFSPFGHYWIGLNDVEEEGMFVWASGEPVTYTNWGVDEPNNQWGGIAGLPGENYTEVLASDLNDLVPGDWNDHRDSRSNNAVVEVIPEPSGIVLAGMVVVGVAGLRGRRSKSSSR